MQPIRKDPAGFKTTELHNARILAGIVNDFEELFLRVLQGTAGRSLAQLIKPIPASSYLHAADLFRAAESIEKHIDDFAAEPAAVAIVGAATFHGRAWADRSLGRFGISTTAPTHPNQKPFYLAPEQKMISMYRERVMSEIKGMTNAQSIGIKRAIVSGFQAGETVVDITKRVREVTAMTKRKAITIARTETLAAGNAAAKDRYRGVGVEMVEWISAADDGRTCQECLDLNGSTYPIDETPEIPAHPNCRCTLVPYREKE